MTPFVGMAASITCSNPPRHAMAPARMVGRLALHEQLEGLLHETDRVLHGQQGLDVFFVEQEGHRSHGYVQSSSRDAL